jgi:hypothetical protein
MQWLHKPKVRAFFRVLLPSTGCAMAGDAVACSTNLLLISFCCYSIGLATTRGGSRANLAIGGSYNVESKNKFKACAWLLSIVRTALGHLSMARTLRSPLANLAGTAPLLSCHACCGQLTHGYLALRTTLSAPPARRRSRPAPPAAPPTPPAARHRLACRAFLRPARYVPHLCCVTHLYTAVCCVPE